MCSPHALNLSCVLLRDLQVKDQMLLYVAVIQTPSSGINVACRPLIGYEPHKN